MMITRCPACGTMFNVVADQLKVSQGWVRCGHCSDVFDASLHLQDTSGFENAGQPDGVPLLPSASEPPLPASLPSSTAALSMAQPTPPETHPDKAVLPPEINDEFAQSLQAAIDASAAAKVLSEEFAVSQPMPLVEPPPLVAVMDSSRALLNEEIEAEESAAAADSASFVQAARRQAFWKKPWIRAVLGLLTLCLLTLLVLQAVVQQKDQLAAWAPQLKPVVQAICQQLGCQLAPLRKMDAVVIDSSTFNRVGADNYKLDFLIKNLATVPLAMPSLEVTLTDTQDQALIRRVLLPAQFGAGVALLTPGDGFTGSITLDVSISLAQRNGTAPAPRITGYRLLAFYP